MRLMFFLVIIFISCGEKSKKPVLFIRNKTQLLDTISLENSHTISYIIQNLGSKDLVIDTISSSCDCTISSFTKKVIKPADSCKLDIFYKPVDEGDFRKAIVIKSNDDSVFTVLEFIGFNKRNFKDE